MKEAEKAGSFLAQVPRPSATGPMVFRFIPEILFKLSDGIKA